MSAKPFIDTNVVVYAFGTDGTKSEKAEALLASGGIVSVQVLNEFVSVSRRKLGRDWAEVIAALEVLKVLLEPALPLTSEMHETALGIARHHNLSIYDSLIVAAALRAGCPLLYSEDLQHGQTFENLTICNPFFG
jgi:predicted nucleic acid-binding protein